MTTLDNARQLEMIDIIVRSILGDSYAHAIEALLAQVDKTLQEKNIYLTLEAGIETLQELVLTQAMDNSQDFNLRLEEWTRVYSQLEAEETIGVKHLLERQGPNISRSLLNASGDPESAFGDDADMQITLKDIIINPRQTEFVSDQTYILQPSLIVPGDAEKEFAKPVETLKRNIQPVLDKCQALKQVRLLIPVVSQQVNWHLLVVGINHGRITGAALLDAAKVAEIQKHPAFQQAQIVVNELNHDNAVKVKAVTTGKEKNNAYSMDDVVQAMLNGVMTDDVASAATSAIREAGPGSELRQAIIGRMIAVSPAIQQASPMVRKYGIFGKHENGAKNIPARTSSLASKVNKQRGG